MTLSRPPIRVRIVGATDVGLIREHNEDNLLALDLDTGDTDFDKLREYDLGPRGLLLVVCDGMGGAAAGEVASSMAVESLRRQMLAAASLSGSPVAGKSGSANPVSRSGSTDQAGRVITMEADADGDPAASDLPPAAPAPSPAVLAAALEKPSPPEISAVSGPAIAADPAPAADPAVASSGAVAAQSSSDKLGKSDAGLLTEAEVHGWARRLRTATQNANQEIFEAACADIAKAGMGTTLTGLLLLRNQVVVAQVGDSRAYLWRQGRLVQITHDQSLVNQLLDSGQITPEQAKLFEHSNVILQALGVQEDVEVVLSHEQLRRDDRILLCSDGLVGVVTDDEIQAVLQTAENPDEAVRMLIEMARAGGGPDNITVIVAHVLGEGLAPAASEELVQYRTMALEGEKAPDRRVWPGDYQSAPGTTSGRDLPPIGTPARPWLSSSVVMVIAAALALVVTGLVIAFVLYPQRATRVDTIPALVTCTLRTEQAGQRVFVDEQEVAVSQAPRTEVKLAPGPHEVWLASATGAGRSVPQSLQANFRQPCELQLFSIVAASASEPSGASGDGPVAAPGDGGAAGPGEAPTEARGSAIADGGSAGKPATTPDETEGHEAAVGAQKPEEVTPPAPGKTPHRPVRRNRPKTRPGVESGSGKPTPGTPPATPGETGDTPTPETPPPAAPPAAPAPPEKAEPKAAPEAPKAIPSPEKPKAPAADSEKPKPVPEAPKATPAPAAPPPAAAPAPAPAP